MLSVAPALSVARALRALGYLAAVGLTACVAFSLGLTLLSALRLKTRSWLLDACLGVGLGYALLGMILFALASCGGLRVWVVWGLSAAIPIMTSPITLVWFLDVRRGWREARAKPEALDVILICAIGATLVGPLLRALSPAYGWDEQVYHLPIPAAYLTAGGFTSIAAGFYANMPHLVDLIYAWPMAVGGAEQGAKLTHWLMTVLSVVTLGAIARGLFGCGRAGLFAGLLFCSLSTVLDEAGMAYVDNALAFFAATMLAALLLARLTGNGRWWWIAGVMAGAMLCSKYVGGSGLLAAGAVGALFIVFPHGAGDRRRVALGVVAMGFVAAMVFVPWAVKQWLATGNPVFPLAYGWLGGEGWSARLDAWFYEWQRGVGPGRSPVDWLLLPWRVFTMSGYPVSADSVPGYWFLGIFSPLPLAMAPFGLLRIWRERKLTAVVPLVLFGAWLIVWGAGPQQIRFLIPATVALCLFGGLGIEELKGIASSKVYRIVAAGVVGFALWFALPEFIANAPNLGVVVGRESKEEFLRERVGPYECFERLRGEDDARVLMVYTNFAYHCPVDSVVDSTFEASMIVDLAERAGSAEELDHVVRGELGCDYILLNEGLMTLIVQHVANLRAGETELQAAYRRGVEVLDAFLLSADVEVIHRANGHVLYRLR